MYTICAYQIIQISHKNVQVNKYKKVLKDAVQTDG